ncbi:hypothetical protein ASPZODRAFT_128418 [Penicilliopsis zonata CBS 506.65]|uniref:Trafficking protein particle complex subunit 10 n=1 Tax=Penicilliopsis zonata CBS 506.65 TaxID=1073090 RepID=A0A1L9SRY4_9EURO|nr:hypothetical protein ASPZODRAFT_128418 [Penicilliopsis zonata CBS 506.65]OJJ49867.1 hypothetical protein ASPZODRAFT_128418 [Penicilliopsis zonata CBS 506.65]
METSPPASSNNVTVAYTDPSGLFPLVQPIIERKLPLRNLHWKSPSRPARSIESLHIGFVPEKHEAEVASSSDLTAATAVPHRRHQIPGLRQTPYLKIYLLRCDDNDTYKASARKALREWIKAHGSTPLSSTPGSSSQEKHDAFEWLIIHVVSEAEGAGKAATTASKWGRTATTVLEKVKADFNGSSKSAVDRVVQLRLPQQAGGGVPAPVLQQQAADLAEQLEDLVEKVQNGILASFDLRVAQYEEDIKEKDSQRSLPGWNFCTFFILKEGLARGFENVGLFEDALAGYDELSLGLDIAIREQLQAPGDQLGSALLASTPEWKDTAMKALEQSSSANLQKKKDGGSDDNDNDDDDDDDDNNNNDNNEEFIPTLDIEEKDFPLDSTRKPYREMILANNISIFDFRTYVFSRQLTLLLRAARAPWLIGKEAASNQRPVNKSKKPEDLLLLAEICDRSTEFIAMAARILRYDLTRGLSDVDHVVKADVIGNIVSSWAYAAVCQILRQIFTNSLTIPESSLHPGGPSSTPGTAAGGGPEAARSNVPRRSSSLLTPSATRSNRSASLDVHPAEAAPAGHQLRRQTLDTQKQPPKITPKTGSEQLASGRGELLSFARRVLEEIAGRLGWSERWNNLDLLFNQNRAGSGDFKEVSLDDGDGDESPRAEGEAAKKIGSESTSTLSGVDFSILNTSLRSRRTFRSLYEELTDQMHRHYIVGNRTYSGEMALADIALLRFRQADYAAAASYFHQLAPFYGNKHWVVLEGTMLEMYAQCLKELNRTEEYARSILRLLAKYAAYSQSRLSERQKTLEASSIFTEESPVASYVQELFDTSGVLQRDVSAPLTDFFADLQFSPAIIHHEDRDGFQIEMSLRFLLGKQIDVDSIKVRLVNAVGSQNEHWIEKSSKFTVKSSLTKILINSSTTLQGKYFVDRVDMRTGNLVFSLVGKNNSTFPFSKDAGGAEEEENRPHIYCYSPTEGLHAKIMSPHHVNLEQMRTLEVELYSGWNDIKTGTIRVRPATAGLRLRVAEAEVVEGIINIDAQNETSTIAFNRFGPRSSARFRIPYTLEENHAMLSARVEVGYETEHGKFSYSSAFNIVSALPISVNVQDIFKHDALFSRFTVGPAMLIPLRILECNIPSSDVYEVEPSMTGPVAYSVFPKQPASLLYKIRQRTDSVPSPGSRRSLRLSVDFTCVDDECLDVVEKKFKADIESSPFRQYSRLLVSHVVEMFRMQLTTSDMQMIGLVREIEMLSYETIHWESLLGSLKGGTNNLRDWLVNWHQAHPTLQLPDHPTILSRRIVIPVDIPDVQVVHTAELRLLNLSDEPAHAAVGQMVAAELRLRHTRRWCYADNLEAAGAALEFSFEMHANPEVWLVGGRRRGNFTAQEGETTTFSLILLPQKAGHLLLPGVEIKTFVPTGGAATSTSSSSSSSSSSAAAGTLLQRKPVPCEVDYRNHGETVLVLPDLKKTTVTLCASSGTNPGGGSWLIDSERR